MKNLFFVIALIGTQLPQSLHADDDKRQLNKKALLTMINNPQICSTCAIKAKYDYIQKHQLPKDHKFINNLETDENIQKKRKPAFNNPKKPCSNPTCCKLKREQDNL